MDETIQWRVLCHFLWFVCLASAMTMHKRNESLKVSQLVMFRIQVVTFVITELPAGMFDHGVSIAEK